MMSLFENLSTRDEAFTMVENLLLEKVREGGWEREVLERLIPLIWDWGVDEHKEVAAIFEV